MPRHYQEPEDDISSLRPDELIPVPRTATNAASASASAYSAPPKGGSHHHNGTMGNDYGVPNEKMTRMTMMMPPEQSFDGESGSNNAHSVVFEDHETGAADSATIDRQLEHLERQQQEVHKDRGGNNKNGEEEESKTICGLSFKCFLLLGVLGFLAIVGIVAAVVVVVTSDPYNEGPGPTDPNEDKEKVTTSSPTLFPSMAPSPSLTTPAPTTLAPSSSPTREMFSPRFEQLFAQIGSQLVDNDNNDPSGSILLDPNTSQHWALRWMADVDAANLSFESMPNRVLMERYAVVLFYNTTGGDGGGSGLVTWLEDYGFLSSFSVCDWNNGLFGTDSRGVYCFSGSTVTDIILRENGLQGAIPTVLGLLSGLEFLDLTDNFISGTLPTFFTEMPFLTRLWLRTNALTGQLPAEIGNFPVLAGLDVATNGFTGTIPTEIGNLSTLAGVALRENLFSGGIPTQFGRLSNTLSYLDLFSTQVNGRIPTELGRLSLLSNLWLDSNNLSGPIPTELGRLSLLEFFRMNSNDLSGFVPSQLGQLTQVTTLYFYSNWGILGRIPTEFLQLTKLINFAVHSTALTGGLEDVFCNGLSFVTTFERLYADCGGTVPELDCSCCSHCCDQTGQCFENF